MNKVIITLSLFFLSLNVFAQKNITTKEQLWLAYFNQTRITSKFGIWADIHWRTSDHFIKDKFQFITHNGLTYFFSDNLRLTSGYTYSYIYPDGGKPGRPEHRPWQQLWWRQNYDRFQTLQWIRFEQRFRRKEQGDHLVEGYNFNYRLRYNLALFIPLKGKKMTAKTPFIAVMDEIFINLGKEITSNYFDNNRFFIGLGYQFTSHLNAQLGYMNLFQEQANGKDFVNTNAIRFFVFHTLDLRKKEDDTHK
jgi:hypothetical protein